jgi:FAD:protein FMN transferase
MISEAKISNYLWLFICSLLLAGCFFDKNQEQNLHELKGDVFGAYYIIKYRGDFPPDKLQSELDQFFSKFNNEFSTYQKNSVISEFNRSRVNHPLKVSARFIEMLKIARRFHDETNGAFDPTLGPVIKAWGFGGGIKKEVPSEEVLKSAMSKVGFHKIQWHVEDSSVWKTQPGVELDINAFAAGWVCDLIGSIFTSKGINNFMIDMSGEILFKGEKGKSNPWIAGIEKPSPKYAESVQRAFKMDNMAISTSGDYRQFFNEQGLRRSHIIDPRTGKPVNHTISSASAIATNGAAADAWSTAMMVLGSEGIALSEKNGIKVLLLEAQKANSFDEILSPSMKLFIEAHQL